MSDTTTNGTAIPVEVTTDEMRVYGAKVWTESNDGAGSGLDADTLDGLDSTQFLRSDIENAGNSQFVDVTASGSFFGDLVGSADHADNADNADNATNAQDAVNAQNAVNAQEAQHAVSADNATNAGTVDGLNGSQFLRSDIENAGNSQFIDVTASGSFYGDLVGSADHAVNADNATNAQDAVNAQNAVNAQEAQHAVSADNATNAGTVDGLNGSQFLRSDIENAGNSQFVDVTASGKFYGDLVGTADNASTLDDYSADLSSTPNTIALRNSTGDLYAQQFKSDVPNETTIDPSAALAFRNNNTDDNGIRFIEDNAEVRAWLETLSIAEIQASLAQKADIDYVNSRATRLAFDKGMFEGM